MFLTVKPDLYAGGRRDRRAARCALPPRSMPRPTATRTRRSSARRQGAVSYGDLMEVMNLLRDAGYLKIALVGLEAPAAKP